MDILEDKINNIWKWNVAIHEQQNKTVDKYGHPVQRIIETMLNPREHKVAQT